MALGVAAAAGALAFAATPALAHEFTASRTGTTSGKSGEVQKFKFGPFKITCMKTAAKGAVTEGSSETLNALLKFGKCSTEAKINSGKSFQIYTVWKTPLDIEYHATHFVETGTETEEVEEKVVLKGGEAMINVLGGRDFKCKISWPSQTLPAAAEQKPLKEWGQVTYAPEEAQTGKPRKFPPDGIQHFLLIKNEFKTIHFRFEGEPCEEWGREEGPEGAQGTYVGSFPLKLTTGNLEYH
ncbi:MAG: hypothetical protein ABSG95_02970 [Solirubrobacteraceae bacterium]|jgi:hypothetical protein